MKQPLKSAPQGRCRSSKNHTHTHTIRVFFLLPFFHTFKYTFSFPNPVVDFPKFPKPAEPTLCSELRFLWLPPAWSRRVLAQHMFNFVRGWQVLFMYLGPPPPPNLARFSLGMEHLVIFPYLNTILSVSGNGPLLAKATISFRDHLEKHHVMTKSIGGPGK